MLFLTSLHSEKVKQKKIRIRFNKDLGTLNRHYVKYYNTTSLMSENKKKKKSFALSILLIEFLGRVRYKRCQCKLASIVSRQLPRLTGRQKALTLAPQPGNRGVPCG